jgi:RHS repeat-associated protein
MPHQKIPDYTPVRMTWLENAVENIGILEKSGVSDYTPFGSIISERSWSLPDDCNTYTSLYYDNMLDIDCFVDCGTWTTFGSRTYLNCNTSSGYLQIGIYGNYRGAYTEFDTETDSTYVVDINITGYNTMATWQVSARDNQGNIIASSMVSQTGPMSFEFTATGSVSRVYVMRVTSYYTFASIALSAVSVTGKYHKEDVMYLSYRYGFNNMEKDDELKGLGNSYDFGARIYDPRVGRWLAVDPLAGKYPNESPFIFTGNSPLIFIDKEGKEKIIYITIIAQDGTETTIAHVDADYVEWAYDGDLGMAAFDVTYSYRIDLRTGEIDKSDPSYSVNIDYNTYDFYKKTLFNIDKSLTGEGGKQKSGFYFVTDEGGSSPTKFEAIDRPGYINVTDLLATFSKGGSAATKPKNLIEALNYVLGNFETGQSIITPVVPDSKQSEQTSVPKDSSDLPLMDNNGKQIGWSRYPSDEKGKADTRHSGRKIYD